jgi:hypothetical protein
MNKKYLASDLEPLKAIGEGKVLDFINNFIDGVNENRENKAELVAYVIKDNDFISNMYCLFKTINGLLYREFTYCSNTKRVDDCLKKTAEYGIGIIEYSMEDFFELREFYKANAKAE